MRRVFSEGGGLVSPLNTVALFTSTLVHAFEILILPAVRAYKLILFASMDVPARRIQMSTFFVLPQSDPKKGSFLFESVTLISFAHCRFVYSLSCFMDLDWAKKKTLALLPPAVPGLGPHLRVRRIGSCYCLRLLPKVQLVGKMRNFWQTICARHAKPNGTPPTLPRVQLATAHTYL